MRASGARIIGTGIIALALQAGTAARAEPLSDLAGETVRASDPRETAQPLHVEAPAAVAGLTGAADKVGPIEPSTGEALATPPRDDAGATNEEPSSEAGAASEEPAAEAAAATEALPASDAIATALRARLEARAAPGGATTREAIGAVYTGRDFQPLWFAEGRPIAAVAAVTARLRQASEDGLDLDAYPLPSTDVTTAEAIAAADIALTDAVVAYGRQATGSRIDPRTIARTIGARPEVADAAVILARVAAAGEQAGAVLRGFNPPHPPYAALRDRLEELRRHRSPAARAARIPAGPTVRVGMRDPRVPLVRARLSLGETEEEAHDSLYDTKVAAAVASFQKAHGLAGSGHLTAQTVAALSGARASKVEAEILANMERWRWMPRDLGEARIEVNIPDFEAVVVAAGAVVQRHRVVVGKEKTPTPVFSEAMRYLIVNPYWNIPPSIIRNEYGSSPKRLRSHGYEVFSRDGRLAARQPPGEKNALGRIKFMFPNDYSVYIHDTPSRALFDEARRAYSHGCVRIDEPFRFADAVLGKNWSEARLKRLIGGKERYVGLPKPLPVHIEYFTAFVDDSGTLQIREDLYGYSKRVRAALGLEG